MRKIIGGSFLLTHPVFIPSMGASLLHPLRRYRAPVTVCLDNIYKKLLNQK